MPITRFLALPALMALAALGIGQSGSATNLSAAIALQAAPAQTPVHLENGSILYAELTKNVDANKAKIGDPVTAVLVADVLAHGKIVVRHGSKLMGHVTEVQLHSKETPESRLGIVFDKAITKDSSEVPFQSLLLAIRPGERPVVDAPGNPSAISNSSNARMQNQHYPSHHVPRIDRTMGDEINPHNRTTPETGPTDIDGLSLSSAASSAPVVVSTQRTVKLESGVKIELRVTGQ
ncbi:MAG: hypothetical protein WA672_21745 [Candidatus Angelobacter sp.]